MGQQPILIGNWKMHKTEHEAKAFIGELAVRTPAHFPVYIAPSFTAIGACSAAARGSSLVIGAQNMSDAKEGAFTGEISGEMLLDAGAQFVLLGHSERRTLFHESDDLINRKVRRAQELELTVVLCIGETLQEREEGRAEEVLRLQLELGLQNVHPKDLMIAYEPVWAIGTGRVATPDIAGAAHLFCRRQLEARWGKEARAIPLLYGGSVKADNIASLLQEKEIDGALIGGASLQVHSFLEMIEQARSL